MTYYRHELSGPILAGDQWTMTLHSNGSVDINTVHTAWTTCATSIANAMKTYWSNKTSTSSVKTFQLDAAKGKNVALVQGNLNIIGAVTGSQGPPSSALVVGLRTYTPTRSGRGRFYLPGLSTTNLDPNGLWLPATITALAPLIGNSIKTFSTTSQVVVYHRYYKDAQGVEHAPTGTSVVSITIGIIPNVQRRRVNKVTQSYTSAAAV